MHITPVWEWTMLGRGQGMKGGICWGRNSSLSIKSLNQDCRGRMPEFPIRVKNKGSGISQTERQVTASWNLFPYL